MTNYKRFITYLYFYEAGKKMGNVGFARVETSDEVGKVTIHCSTKVVPSKECKVYLLKRTKSMTISKQVAVATSQNGSLDIKLSYDRGRIDGSEFNLKDTQGVVILYSKDNYIAAKWDDSNVSYHEVILLDQEDEIQQPIPKVINNPIAFDKEDNHEKEALEAAQIEQSQESEAIVQPRIVIVDEADIVTLGKVEDLKKMADHKKISEHKEVEEAESQLVEKQVEKDREIVNSVKQDNLQTAEVVGEEKKEVLKKSIKDIIRENIRAEKEKELVKEKELEKEKDLEKEIDLENEKENVSSEEIINNENSPVEEEPKDDTELKDEALHAANYAVPNPNLWADHPSARAILNRFVRMYPFDDGEIAECVRLEPKDIGLLPMSAWVLGNNSFLLHSYCNFRHLLFAKKLTREGCVYLLMVPGSHNNREQQLAKMFGFENFKCSRRRSMRDGEFGYWYVTIVFD